MKLFNYILLVFITLLLSIGCSDFLAEDISDEKVNLRAPYNGLVTENSSTSFWWDTLEWTDSYMLEVVSPSYDSLEYVTILIEQDGNIYDADLSEGNYQWSVVAHNSAYEAYSDTFDLTVVSDTISDLATQELILLGPEEDFLTNNNTNIEFEWETLSTADTYTWELASPDFSSFTNGVSDEILINGIHTQSVIQEGIYKWRVRANNDQSFVYSEERNLVIDLTAPDTPVLLLPDDLDTVSLPITLSWNSDNDTYTNTLQIFTDSLLTDIYQEEALSTENFTLENMNQDTSYFWRVKSVDEVGNSSDFSNARKIWVE